MCSSLGERGWSIQDQPYQGLRLSLDSLRQEDLEALPAPAMEGDLLELRRHINCCEAEFTRRLARYDNGQGYVASGALDPKPWLRWQCHLSPSVASDRVEVARRLAALPQTRQAFAEGEISYQHAAMIARTAEALGEKMEAQAETILVEAAKELDTARLRCVTLHLRHCLQPDGVLGDANEAHDDRFLHLSQSLDGIFYIDGRFDSEAGPRFVRLSIRSCQRRPPMMSGRRRSAGRMRWWSWRGASSMLASCPRWVGSARTWR